MKETKKEIKKEPKKLTPEAIEAAKKIVSAESAAKLNACQQEVAKVLAKYNCKIVANTFIVQK